MLEVKSQKAILTLFQWLLDLDERRILRGIFEYLLGLNLREDINTDLTEYVSAMIESTRAAPPLAVTIANGLDCWQTLDEFIYKIMVENAQTLLIALITAAHEAQSLMVEPFKTILHQLPHMPLSSFVELVKLTALTIRNQELALDILIESLESQGSRLLGGQSSSTRHYIQCLIGVALDHIAEVMEAKSHMEGLVHLRPGKEERVVICRLRVDQKFGSLGMSDHIRLTTATSPSNSLTRRLYSFDAIIKSKDHGEITLECFQPLPHFPEDCSWKMTNCGSFVTSQTMFDAIARYALQAEEYCPLQESILGQAQPSLDATSIASCDVRRDDLNECQNEVLKVALTSSMTCLWGPPGTGKSHTVVAILQEMLATDVEQRILVAAPTHNAVDNVMRKYISRSQNSAA